MPPTRHPSTEAELPATAIDRPRLLARLDDATRHRLTVVVGPSGSGKSVLLRQWATTRPPGRVAWLAVEDPGVDAVSFGRQLVGALAAGHPGVGGGALPHLEAGGDRLGRAFLAALATELAALPPTTLVVEDAHDLPLPLVDELRQLLALLPPHLGVVVSSREEPALGLPRRRAHGELGEIRAAELAFTAEEAAVVVAHIAGRTPGPDQLEDLWRRTEGWVVGVQLAALALRHGEAGRGGAHPDVATWLMEEVVHHQPPEVRELLLATSVLDRFDAELCDGLTGRRDAAQVLAELERRDLFLVPVAGGPGRYRYHQLFRDALRRQLRHEDPARHDELLARAAQLHLARGEVAPAIACLLGARRWTEALDLIGVNGWALYAEGEASRTIRWLEAVPADERWRHDQAPVTLALLHRLVGNAATADRLLDELEARSGPGSARRMGAQVIRAAGINWGTPPAEALAQAEAALAWLEAQPRRGGLRPGEEPWGWTAGAARIHAARALVHLGRDAEARRSLEGSLDRLAPHSPWFIRALGLLARLDARDGTLHRAEGRARQSLRVAAEVGTADATAVLDAWLALAAVAYERDDLDGCERALDEVAPRAQVVRAHLPLALVAAGRARVALARGQVRAGLAVLARWRREGSAALPPDVVAHLASIEAELLATRGDADRARQALAGVAPTPEVVTATARLAASEGDLDALAMALDRWPASPRPRARVQHGCWRAVLAHHQGDPAEAGRRLDAALALAGSEGHRRSVLDVGAALAPVVEARHPTSAPTLLAALGDAGPRPRPPGPRAAALSPREVEVVRLLGGVLSNDEVAARLGISPNTLKTHLRRLYRKLGVTTRHQAWQRAVELGLVTGRGATAPAAGHGPSLTP